MMCPICGFPSMIVATANTKSGLVERERQCLNSHNFKTWEIHEATMVAARKPVAAKIRAVQLAAKRWARDASICASELSNEAEAKVRKLSAARIRQIRNLARIRNAVEDGRKYLEERYEAEKGT